MEADISKVVHKSHNISKSNIKKSSDKFVRKFESKEESVFHTDVKNFTKKDIRSSIHNLTQFKTKQIMTIESSASEGRLTAIILNNLTTVATQHNIY